MYTEESTFKHHRYILHCHCYLCCKRSGTCPLVRSHSIQKSMFLWSLNSLNIECKEHSNCWNLFSLCSSCIHRSVLLRALGNSTEQQQLTDVNAPYNLCLTMENNDHPIELNMVRCERKNMFNSGEL